MILLLFAYEQYAPIPFPTLKTPGEIPTHDLEATVELVENITNSWQHANTAYNIHKEIDCGLQSFLISGVDIIYIGEFRIGLLSFSTYTIRDLSIIYILHIKKNHPIRYKRK